MIRRIAALVLACLAGFAAAAPAETLPSGVKAVTTVEGIAEYKLGNGLQVLLVRDDSKPTTTVNLTVHVGSRQENYGETGMAHLLEHMMFKGTPAHPKVWAEFEKRGLAANGSTSMDRTNYTARFSANEDNLNWYVGWLADAMVHSYVARKDLDTEMTVVRNEMESGENSAERTLYKKTLAVMFDWHNYGKDTIGARSDVENVDIPRLQAFYRTYYQPDNATLIVSGRFDTTKLLKVIDGSFGKIKKPARKLPGFYTLDPVQDGERSVTLRRVGGVPIFFAGYHVPPAAAPDYAAIEILSSVMGDAPSGRLHKRLTEKGLAAETFAFSSGQAEPGFAIFGAQLSPGQDVDRARDALLATLESTRTEPITQAELDRAKAKWAKGWEQSFTNPETVGLALSESVAQGDWRMFFLLRDRVRDIGLADVQRVATQYLMSSNRTLGTYVPSGPPERAPAPAKVDVAAEMATFHPQAGAQAAEQFDATPENIERRTERFQVGGVKAALLPKATRGGAVFATLTLHFGDAASLAGHGEVPATLAQLLDKGTATLSREQVQDKLDALRTELSFGSSPGQLSVSMVSRREHLPAAIALVGELLRRPALPDDALAEIKEQTLAAVAQQRKKPEALVANALARLGDPYPPGDVRHARTFDEIEAEVKAVTPQAVRDFHARFYGARQAEFGAAGDMDVAAVRAALASALGDWQAGAPFTRVPDPLVARPAARLLLPAPDTQNATMLTRLAVPLTDNDADYPALMMANYLLGGGGNSRLWKRVREREGLSYDVRSVINWSSLDANSDLRGSAIFAPQNRAKVEAAFRDEIDRALKEGFTADELAQGQRGLLSYRRLARAQDGAIAALLARNLYLDRTMEIAARVDKALASLTLDQVNAALRKYVRPDAFASAYAGDFKP